MFSRDQLLDEGWLGPGPVIASIRRRVGDVILAPREPVAFVDPDLPNEANLVGAHGSLTADEMFVPLLAARGRANSGAMPARVVHTAVRRAPLSTQLQPCNSVAQVA